MKPLKFVGSARRDLSGFPSPVKLEFGHALFTAQVGDFPLHAKPLKGFGGASVVELVEDYDGETYRCIYTTRIGVLIVVLHAFQKKSKSGIATPKHEIDLIKSRLKDANEGRWK